MRMNRVIMVLAAAMVVSASFGMTGCADREARMMAEEAQACCEANQERIERMYQKLMSK